MTPITTPPALRVDADTGADLASRHRLAAHGRERAEDARLSLVEQIFDPESRRRRQPIQPGWRCLEVGAGRGSMAIWLAEQVGPAGEVVAADIDTRYLVQLDVPNLTVVTHNILEDPLESLGPGSFDLVCWAQPGSSGPGFVEGTAPPRLAS